MLKDANRRRFDLVMAWSIDRVGRSLSDLLGTIQHLEAVGVDLYLDQQNIDTTTPTGRLLFQITGAFAEFQRSIIRARVNLGLSRARAQGKRLGRRPVSADVVERIRTELVTGAGPQNGQSAGRRHRNGASGETRDGGYSILRRAGLGRWKCIKVAVMGKA